MLVKGSVLTTDGTPIPNAKIDVWQANDDGFYDVQQKGHQPDFNLRGIFRTDNEGRYWFNAEQPKGALKNVKSNLISSLYVHNNTKVRI